MSNPSGSAHAQLDPKLTATLNTTDWQDLNLNCMSESELLFEEAKHYYEAWLSDQGYTARQGQLDMMRFISESLTRKQNRFGVIEAGTGTGKTVAYCIPAVIQARRQHKTLVIVTSTVLLQQQLLHAELHQLGSLFSPKLSFGIIKGRRRYACIDRLDKSVNSYGEEPVDLFGEKNPSRRDRRIASELLDRFTTRQWDGDMDAAPIFLSRHDRSSFTTDAIGCHRQSCEYAKPCPYFRVRNRVSSLDVVVTNYSLLMAAGREGIDMLPAPEDCIYVFDEVHRLADIVMTSGAVSANTSAVTDVVNEIEKFINRLMNNVEKGHPLSSAQQDILDVAPRVAPLIDQLRNHFAQLTRTNAVEPDSQRNVFRFVAGRVDEGTSDQARVLASTIEKLFTALNDLFTTLDDARTQLPMWINTDVLGSAVRSLTELLVTVRDMRAVFDDWGSTLPGDSARWLTPEESEWRMHTVPIAVDEILTNAVWSQAHSVICTSATIYSSKGFDQFKQEIGLNLPDEHFERIASPFNFRRNVRFQVANIGFSQPGGDAFNSAAAKYLPQLLAKNISGLVLFTSRTDMEKVFRQLPDGFRELCLMQDELSMVETLRKHRVSIDNGGRSYIFGLVSYREGVDLPGDYCQHVVIMRIPFNVPDDPVIKSQKELLGLANAFMQYDVPQASLRLFQACGRLLRSEKDRGSITILDRRIIEKKQYCDELTRPLPDFEIVDLKKQVNPIA